MSIETDIRGPARATHGAVAYVADVEAEIPDAPAAPEPAAAPAKSTPQAENNSGAGFLALVLGGAIAAGAGFAAATFLDLGGGAENTEFSSRISGVEESIGQITGRLDGLDASVSEIETALEDVKASIPDANADALAEISATVEGLGSDVGTVRADIDALKDSVANISITGSDGGAAPDFAAAFDAQMGEFRAEVDRVTAAAEAEVAAARAEAEATRAAAEAEAAAAREAAERAELKAQRSASFAALQTALDTGAPLAEALSGLSGLEIPAALSDAADTGIVPLSELQRTFPDAARAALAAADRGPAEDAGAVDRVAAFFREQTNARSLEPREGNDADAILSRAEATLRAGDLSGALAELSGLADGPKAALGDWLTGAIRRDAATSAAATLSNAIDAM